jgi:hypothetical protein
MPWLAPCAGIKTAHDEAELRDQRSRLQEHGAAISKSPFGWVGGWASGYVEPTARREVAAPCSPEAPLAGLHDPNAEEQISSGVGKNARGQAAGTIGDEIVKQAGD